MMIAPSCIGEFVRFMFERTLDCQNIFGNYVDLPCLSQIEETRPIYF